MTHPYSFHDTTPATEFNCGMIRNQTICINITQHSKITSPFLYSSHGCKKTRAGRLNSVPWRLIFSAQLPQFLAWHTIQCKTSCTPLGKKADNSEIHNFTPDLWILSVNSRRVKFLGPRIWWSLLDILKVCTPLIPVMNIWCLARKKKVYVTYK